MREDEFKAWLAERGANTQAGRNTRAYAVRTIENNLAALGSPHTDLDAAWMADRFAHLRQRIKDIQQDFRAGGTEYRILMPQSEKPENRLTSWRSWLAQYSQFLSGDEDSTDRQHAHLRHLVSTLGRKEIDAAIELCDEEGLEAFLANRSFRPPQRWIVAEDGRRYPAKAIVAAAVSFLPDGMELTVKTYFGGFGEPEAFARLTALGYVLSSSGNDAPAVWLVTALDGTADGLPGFIERGDWHLLYDNGSRYNRMVREMRPGDRIFMRDYLGNQRNPPFPTDGSPVSAMRIRASGVVTASSEDGLSVSVDWQPFPQERLWWLYTNNDTIWGLKDPGKDPNADRLRAFLLDGAEQDLAWFLDRWFGSTSPDAHHDEVPMPAPMNLILYGPPGTGKTYATAREAVRLCGKAVPEDRETLMALYHSLQHKGRIGFVTFHQNFAYEDFVEGLRPVTDGESEGAGFTLEPQDGVFKQMAALAALPAASAQETAQSDGTQAIPAEAALFRMSLGDAADPRYNWVFDQSIVEGYALFSFVDVDWSNARFDDPAQILAELQRRFPHKDYTAGSGAVESTHLFRNVVRRGDVIVVSKGKKLLRAVGIVEGDYAYHPREDGRYCHRRKVRWLWHDRDGLPVSTLRDRQFGINTISRLPREGLNLAALERLVSSNGAPGAQLKPRPHVLIIDEINRANISRVFGELITLLEPDKRLGMPNALTVRLPYSKTEFGVPANLHVIGTMNTADRSIALLDTALRRRFIFHEMAPDPALLATVEGIPLPRVLATINDRIEYLIDREHRIGHAFFIHCAARTDVDAVMRDKVIPLLQEYFFEDWSRIAAVIGPGFIRKGVLKAPPGLGDLQPRPKWEVLAEFAATAYEDLVGGREVTETPVEEEDAPE